MALLNYTVWGKLVSGCSLWVAMRMGRNKGTRMNKRDLLLAALAAGAGDEHTPVQIQKLLFLVEKNVADDLGGAAFRFVPYDYGPFDSSVYDVLRSLESEGLAASAVAPRGWKKYKLTAQGQALGDALLRGLPQRAGGYIRTVSEFVRRLSFAQLVSSVYKSYPEMKANSVFKG